MGDIDESDDNYDETSLKIMAVLSLFARLATQRQQSLITLSNPIQGIPHSDLELIDKNDEMLNILNALKLKGALEAVESLKKNGFAFKVSSNRHVLSAGAMVMINTLIEHYKEV